MTAVPSSFLVSTFEPRVLGELPPAPLVSILLANYNYAHYIGESIESVLRQTYRNWELIVCDDGSTDDSRSVIHGFVENDSRIRLVSQENGGHGSALNAAFSVCSGEIICFLDSDDLYLPEKLDAVVTACLTFPQAGIIAHAVIRVDEQRRRQGVWPLSVSSDGWLGPDVLKAGGVLPFAPPTSGIALRREIADVLFPVSLRPPLHMCPDQVLMRLAPLITQIKRLPDALAEYRLHQSNAYAQQGVKEESINKQLAYSHSLWEEQHRFLAGIDPDVATQLAGLGNSPYTALLQYLAAKLRHDPEVRRYQQDYLTLRSRNGETKFSLFWHISVYLPNFLFRPAVGLLLGHGPLKQIIARVRKLA